MAIDLLNLQPSVISRDLRGKYILLAGRPKVGKTELCSQSPDALIFSFEKGTNARPGVYAQPIQSWSDFKLGLRQLERPELHQKFQTICIDTVAIAYQLCEDFICSQNGVTKIGDIPYGAGYKLLSKEFESALRKITMMDYGLIMTCHLKERTLKDNQENETYTYAPDLNERCLGIVNGLVDIIGVIVQEWNESNESERWLITRATPTITAGSRFKYLAPKIPFGYEHLVEAVANAVAEEEKRGATVVDVQEVYHHEELVYDELMSEAFRLWTTYCTADEDIAKRVLKKVEMTFNRPMKISEIMEDQVELLNLVVLDMKEMFEKE